MQQRSLACVAQMQERKTTLGERSTALDHVVDSTDHVAAGLFHCSDVTDLPRTKNDLEHCCGIARAHERRATGRRGAIPGVVVRGSVRVVAVLVSTQEVLQAADLQPRDDQTWRDLRTHLHAREETRRHQWRFRKDPDASLAVLEAQLSEECFPFRVFAQVQMLIHADPRQAIQETPWQWESFRMRPGSLMSKTRWQGKRGTPSFITVRCKRR